MLCIVKTTVGNALHRNKINGEHITGPGILFEPALVINNMLCILSARRIGIYVIFNSRTVQTIMHKGRAPGSREINPRMTQVYRDHTTPVAPPGALLNTHLGRNDSAYFRVRKSTTQSEHEKQYINSNAPILCHGFKFSKSTLDWFTTWPSSSLRPL
jgi:hypothetical protein